MKASCISSVFRVRYPVSAVLQSAHHRCNAIAFQRLKFSTSSESFTVTGTLQPTGSANVGDYAEVVHTFTQGGNIIWSMVALHIELFMRC